MNKRELVCIVCPLGCMITVTLEGEEILKVKGNTCKRGEDYARKECLHPARTVTSTVRVSGGEIPMVSVKTSQEIPKEKTGLCMKELKGIEVPAPVAPGDVIVRKIAGTNADIIATKQVKNV